MNTRRITRRLVLGSVGAASLSPALRGEMRPAGTPPASATPLPPAARPSFTMEISLGALQAGASAGQRWAVVTDGRVDGDRWQGAVTTGQIDCTVGPGGITEIASRLMVRTTPGQMIELRQRAVAAEHGEAGMPMNLRCEISQPGVDAEAWPALLVGRLDASALAEGRLRSVVFEVI